MIASVFGFFASVIHSYDSNLAEDRPSPEDLSTPDMAPSVWNNVAKVVRSTSYANDRSFLLPAAKPLAAIYMSDRVRILSL